MKQIETQETPISTNQPLSENTEQWDLIIKPQSSILDIPWADIWRYRDLLVMFVKVVVEDPTLNELLSFSATLNWKFDDGNQLHEGGDRRRAQCDEAEDHAVLDPRRRVRAGFVGQQHPMGL